MKVEYLKLKNFHGFEEREITFEKKFTVMIGDNSSGKTAILEGIAVALGGIFQGFDLPTAGRNIHKHEVRLVTYEKAKTVEPKYPVVVTCKGRVNDKVITWTRKLNTENGRTTRNEAREIIKWASELRKNVRNGSIDLLPVLAYYGTGRLFAVKKEKTGLTFKAGSRFVGYTDCLDPNSSEKLFSKWFKQMCWQEFMDGEEPGVLKAVRNAISICIENVEYKGMQFRDVKIDYIPKKDEIVISLPNGNVLPLRLLSDGYRNMIGMVADLAFRMAVLNPFLEERAALETPGVVLIDEIDLHLHPKWQRHIVDDLKRAFPKVQFIATTHSPFIIQSLAPGELRVLDEIEGSSDERIVVPDQDLYVNKSVEDVTENVMGVDLPSRSERLQRMYEIAKMYYTLLKKAADADEKEKEQIRSELDELKEKLDELSAPFSDDVVYHAFLDMERMNAGLGRNGHETDK
jgi:predicted ATP-binding protein involved in virulence